MDIVITPKASRRVGFVRSTACYIVFLEHMEDRGWSSYTVSI